MGYVDSDTMIEFKNKLLRKFLKGEMVCPEYEMIIYEIGDIVFYNGKFYICNTDILVGEEFNPNHWDETLLLNYIWTKYAKDNDVVHSIGGEKGNITLSNYYEMDGQELTAKIHLYTHYVTFTVGTTNSITLQLITQNNTSFTAATLISEINNKLTIQNAGIPASGVITGLLPSDRSIVTKILSGSSSIEVFGQKVSASGEYSITVTESDINDITDNVVLLY